MKVELDSAGTVSVHADGLDAHQVDKLIHDLGNLRPHMQPEVTMDVEPLLEDGRLLVTVRPHLFVSRSATGLITLLFRHRGLGWFCFELPDDQAAFIRDVLSKRLAARGSIPTVDDSAADEGTYRH